MKSKISWFEIMGGDGDKQRKFYAELFNWKIDANNAMNYGVVSDKDAGTGGGIGPNPEGGPGYVTVYVGVDDIHAAMDRMQKLGGTVVMPPTELPEFGLTFAQFKDPAGLIIGLTQNA